MKTLYALMIALVTIVSFSSCQKEIGFSSRTENIDSVISKMIILDTTFPSGADTFWVNEFFYDVQGRMSKYSTVNYNEGVTGPGRIEYSGLSTYIYFGTQILPARIEETFTEAVTGAVDNYVNYLTYTNGYVSKDSFTQDWGFYRVLVFDKVGVSRYRTELRTEDLSGQLVEPGFLNTVVQNGNLVRQQDSFYLLATGPWVVSTVDNIYDTKKNPFKPFSLPYPSPDYSNYPGNVGIPEFSDPSPNNVRTKSYNSGGIDSYTYEYGPTDLPKIARFESRKIYFYYKQL